MARRIGIAKMVGVGYGGLYSKEAPVGFRKIGLVGTTSRGLGPYGGSAVCLLWSAHMLWGQHYLSRAPLALLLEGSIMGA